MQEKICIIKYTYFNLIPLKQRHFALNLIIVLFKIIFILIFDVFLTYSHYTDSEGNGKVTLR